MAIYDDSRHIPIEIAAKICKKVEFYNDYESFAKVCSSWRSAAKKISCQYINRKHTQLPWLMLVDQDDNTYRRYYSLANGLFRKLDLPLIYLSHHKVTRYFSSRGWLIGITNNFGNVSKTTDEYCAYFDITLFDPFSDANVKPPLLCHTGTADNNNMSFFGKFVVSTSPMSKVDASIDDLVVATTFGQGGKLAFWRRGKDDTWVVPSSLGLGASCFTDLCFFRGEIYAVDKRGKVFAFGGIKDHKGKCQARPVANMRYYESGYKPYVTYYVVEAKCDQRDTSSLLVIRRLFTCVSSGKIQYSTISFKVSELNVDNGNVEQVNSLGNQAIFIGSNSTFILQACTHVDDEQGCKKDCIYYTDEWFETGGHDIGIYSLAQGRTHSFYKGPPLLNVVNSPIWVEFSTA